MLAVFGHVGETGIDRLADGADIDRLAVHQDVAV